MTEQTETTREKVDVILMDAAEAMIATGPLFSPEELAMSALPAIVDEARDDEGMREWCELAALEPRAYEVMLRLACVEALGLRRTCTQFSELSAIVNAIDQTIDAPKLLLRQACVEALNLKNLSARFIELEPIVDAIDSTLAANATTLRAIDEALKRQQVEQK